MLVIDQDGRLDVNSWGGVATFTAIQQGLIGVVIVPQEHLADALAIAQECAETEERVEDWIAQGVHPVEAHEHGKYDQMTSGRGRC